MQRRHKGLWARLKTIASMDVSLKERLMKRGAARSKAPSAWRIADVAPDENTGVPSFSLNRDKLRTIRRSEGRYLLQFDLTERDPALLWQYYIQLVAAEEAFKVLKGDLAIRPIVHRDERRIEAQIFVTLLADCPRVTLTRYLQSFAPRLAARSALVKGSALSRA